jgi:hypothetical protein
MGQLHSEHPQKLVSGTISVLDTSRRDASHYFLNDLCGSELWGVQIMDQSHSEFHTLCTE